MVAFFANFSVLLHQKGEILMVDVCFSLEYKLTSVLLLCYYNYYSKKNEGCIFFNVAGKKEEGIEYINQVIKVNPYHAISYYLLSTVINVKKDKKPNH